MSYHKQANPGATLAGINEQNRAAHAPLSAVKDAEPSGADARKMDQEAYRAGYSDGENRRASRASQYSGASKKDYDDGYVDGSEDAATQRLIKNKGQSYE